MTDLTPQGVVRAMWDALNARDYARAAGAIAQSCEWTSIPTGAVLHGPQPIVVGLREFVTAFPDWRADVHRVMPMGNLVVVEWTTSGTFTAPFRGTAPNGRRFERRGCSVAEVERGLIVRYRDYYDRLTLLQQLGISGLA